MPEAELFRALLPEQGWIIATPAKSISAALRVGCVIAPRGRSSELSRAVLQATYGVSAAIKHVTQFVLSHPEYPRIEDLVSKEIDVYLRTALNHLSDTTVKYKPSIPFFWVELPNTWRGRSPSAIRISVNAAFGLEVFENAIEKLAKLLRNPPEKIRA